MVEGFTFKVAAQGFAPSSQECIEALDSYMSGVAARVKALKVPEQLALEAEEDELEAAAAARVRHAEMKEEERLKRLADTVAAEVDDGSVTASDYTLYVSQARRPHSHAHTMGLEVR